MKKSILFAFCSILFFAFSVSAQDETNRYGSSRLNTLLDQLKRTSVDLADRTSENLRGGGRRGANRSDIEAAFLAQQLDASVGFFQEFARDGRRASELRDAASVLSDLLRRAPSFGLNSNLWRDAQNIVSDINREIGNNNSGGGGNNNPREGRANWRGRIDDNVQLIIQGSNIETRRISGKTYPPGTFNFNSPLPTRNVTVDFQKNGGRSTNIRVLQQPSRNNNYTAIIQIIDEPFGADEYDLEIFWQ